jgi:ABC-type sugar transport system substrate-binding protein
VLLLTNAGLVVGSMWIFGLESFSAHALMTVALAGSIAFILFLVADLDNPFWGSWRVGPEAFQRALGLFQPASAEGEAHKHGG